MGFLSKLIKRKPCKTVKKGCFAVHVGPEKQRFLVKAKLVNHPLFVSLLEEAESEFGYQSSGPIALPCDVDIFSRVLAEIEYDLDDDDDESMSGSKRRSSMKKVDKYGSVFYSLLSPSRSSLTKLNQLI